MKNNRKPSPDDRPAPLRMVPVLAATLLLVSACGQRGPLYLPDDSAAGQSATSGEEQAGDKNNDEEDPVEDRE